MHHSTLVKGSKWQGERYAKRHDVAQTCHLLNLCIYIVTTNLLKHILSSELRVIRVDILIIDGKIAKLDTKSQFGRHVLKEIHSPLGPFAVRYVRIHPTIKGSTTPGTGPVVPIGHHVGRNILDDLPHHIR